ncbi:MAG: DNA repair protein RecN [Rhodocyclaceae bacterium]|nr:DNA repair protein RecN [Rhodocyclaceae bacterium]
MLRRLAIRDFVLVDALELEFSAGFGALTGETGAGKSILIDALALTLGERADPGQIRAGAARSDISAEFDLVAGTELAVWLGQNDFDCDGGAVLLRRVVDSAGRSRAYINGASATVAQLREAGEYLVDIHGQHAHHALLRKERQRALLDEHAGLAVLAREVAQSYRGWQTAAARRREFEGRSAALAAERDMLEWQVSELRALEFEPQQWEDLNQEQRRLAHAANLQEGVEAALAELDEGENALRSRANAQFERLSRLLDFDAGLGDAAQLADAARIALDEATHALRRYADRLEMEPGRLEQVDRRIAEILDLARKHRIAPEQLPATLASLAARLDELAGLADGGRLDADEACARAAFFTRAERLSAGRREAASALAARVCQLMENLALAGGKFEIALDNLPDGSAGGLEDVEFRVAANAGVPPGPLARVASGGELSRIGLAIQVIASSTSGAASLVFDEVDVGIGGRVAEIVGRMLADLGKERQVLCVTHLPQVAAQADWQWSIAKQGSDGAVVSRVDTLTPAGRIEEIARMLGGVRITDKTRAHAEELLAMRARS